MECRPSAPFLGVHVMFVRVFMCVCVVCLSEKEKARVRAAKKRERERHALSIVGVRRAGMSVYLSETERECVCVTR